jgi:hypothetical protein
MPEYRLLILPGQHGKVGSVMSKKATSLKQLRELSKELGIELPQLASSNDIGSQAHRVRLLEFARTNDCIITPIGWQYYIDSFAMFNCCPCDKTRANCPCPEAIKEVHNIGYCLCKLFWRSYATYQSMREVR